ncbi:glycosyltransferase [Fulvivirga sedimenti]|uniref:Glycosyltransferase n=1 Tax=Fulvivirga sedimenti TaxID=2879465 RepID=A0A9X1L317_9BACT|nr:glycosyltransferase [Fulvivirga sedimenti]MCA6078766.1 glycosyltransferase [Fulvivirga sedimenti]
MDFLIVAKQPWENEVAHNAKNIAFEIARDHRVVYVNPPLSRKEYLFGKTHPIRQHKSLISNGDYLEKISENLWVFYPSAITESINWIRSHRIFDWLNRHNNLQLAKSLNWLLDELQFTSYMLFNDSEMFQALDAPELLEPKPLRSIYYIRDNLITQPYWKRHGTRIEPLLAARYDMVVSNSDFLGDYLREYNPKTYMVGQGCDLTLFDAEKMYEMPADMKDISGIKVGYTGFLTSMRLDIDLLEHSARKNPGLSFILVGPEDDDFQKSALHGLPNVYFLGNKPIEELSSYIHHFDIAINPQVVNGMTIGNYPRKIDEYLAMGKPVVARKTRAMDYFGEHVYLYESESEFIECVNLAMKENNSQKRNGRIEFARQHTWKSNVENMLEIIFNAG